MSTSKTPSSHMSVVTQFPFQSAVTNSSKLSASLKEGKSPCCWEDSSGTFELDSDFSTAGVGAVLSRCKRRKLCSLMR
jgi:hypothetical protein